MARFKIKSEDSKPYLKNPLKIIGLIWHLYNVPFDRQLSDIKDLNILVKMSLLALLVAGMLIGATGANKDGQQLPGIYVSAFGLIVLLILAIFWLGYLPFMIVRILIFYYKMFFGKK